MVATRDASQYYLDLAMGQRSFARVRFGHYALRWVDEAIYAYRGASARVEGINFYRVKVLRRYSGRHQRAIGNYGVLAISTDRDQF